MTLQQGQRLTALLIVAGAAFYILYDLLIYKAVGNVATISKTFLTLSEGGLMFVICVVFCGGVFVGHVFLPQTKTGGNSSV